MTQKDMALCPALLLQIYEKFCLRANLYNRLNCCIFAECFKGSNHKLKWILR